MFQHFLVFNSLGRGVKAEAWLKLKIGAAQVDDAPYREDLGREAEDDDKDDDPIELMILVLAGELEQPVENIEQKRRKLDRECDQPDDDQINRHSTLARVPS